MANIDVKEKWFTDPRRLKLVRLCGGNEFEADGMAVWLWRMGQQYLKNGRSLIPKDIMDHATEAKPKLIEAKLMITEADCYYVVGSQEYLSWLEKRREGGRIGGASKSPSKLKHLKQYRSKTVTPNPIPNPIPNPNPNPNLENICADFQTEAPKDPPKDAVADIIGFLNRRIGDGRFQPRGTAAKLVRALLNDNHTPADLKVVIDHRAKLWLEDPKMADYLRPSTLFRKSKFEEYLPSALGWVKQMEALFGPLNYSETATAC